MKAYDTGHTGMIELFDIPKVIKKLGILNSEPHIESLVRLADIEIKNENRVDIK
jgi:Ca2+-binding EF-hand superfamily protein